MTELALHIFPESSLASSLITTVWIGVFVTCFFNLRFGWNKSGLIIPGYLVPLIILKPWSAFAIIVEGLITYLIVKMFSEFGSFSKMWSNYFGRDRFFLLFVVAIMVRVLFDEILFPQLTVFLSNNFNIDFVYKGGLYSIGLVIVALTANHFWNSGLKRGFPHLIVILFFTYVIIQYILIPFTNFRLNDIIYLYEDIATSIAASPKAYIILTVTAFFASRMNLLYGWEFSGIIIPALLALQWYFPWKIASSILEAGIIYGIATLLLKSRFFLNSTIEGARKILLFFNIAFIYKILLGFILPLIISDAPVTDTYGLGYMLTSLIAIKMYDKKIGLKMTRSILQVSIISIIIATFIGFALLALPNPFINNKDVLKSDKIKKELNISFTDKNLLSVISGQQITLYGNNDTNYKTSSKDLDYFQTALLATKYYINTKSNSSLNYALKNFDNVSLDVKIVQNKYLVLFEKNWKRARGIYVISLKPNTSQITVSIPYPICNPLLVTAATDFFEQTNAQALAISNGTEKNPGDLLKKEQTLYGEFIKFFSSFKSNTLTLLTSDNITEFKTNELNIDKNQNYIVCDKNKQFNNIPENYISKFKDFKEITNQKIFREYKNLAKGYLLSITNQELISYLSKLNEYQSLASNNMKKILEPFDKIFDIKKPKSKSMFSYLTSIFSKAETKKVIKYTSVKLTNQKADFLDRNIVSPLVYISTKDEVHFDSKEFLSKIKSIDFAANDIDFAITLYTEKSGLPDYIVLSNNSKRSNELISGAYFFKTTKSNPYILEVFNLNQPISLKISNNLANYLNPSVMLFAISPIIDVNLSQLTDITIPSRSTFNLVNQVSMREIDSSYSNYIKEKNKNKPHVIQVRSLTNTKTYSYPKNTVYLSTYLGKYKYSQLSDTEKRIYKHLKNIGFDVKFVHGVNRGTAGLEAIKLEQSRYMTSTIHFHFIVLWFSPDIDIDDLSFKNIEKIAEDKEKVAQASSLKDKDKSKDKKNVEKSGTRLKENTVRDKDVRTKEKEKDRKGKKSDKSKNSGPSSKKMNNKKDKN